MSEQQGFTVEEYNAAMRDLWEKIGQWEPEKVEWVPKWPVGNARAAIDLLLSRYGNWQVTRDTGDYERMMETRQAIITALAGPWLDDEDQVS